MKFAVNLALWLLVVALASNIVTFKSYYWGWGEGYREGKSDRFCPLPPGDLIIPTPPYWRPA